MKFPIHQHEGKWYFWGEVWWEGPYETKKECELALQGYRYHLKIRRLKNLGRLLIHQIKDQGYENEAGLLDNNIIFQEFIKVFTPDEIIIGGYSFPTKCPENCPGKDEYSGQGGLCHRCPIFNCVPAPNDPEAFTLLRPEEYRTDWAKVWYEWFQGNMKGLPDLKF